MTYSFETASPVRFAHVDAAGIVFYPRYFEMLNAAVEDWFAEAIGAPFRQMHLERGIGVPTVRLDAQFVAPGRLGDDLAITITPREVGRSSCAFVAGFMTEGRELLRVDATIVCMDLGTGRSTPWPDDIRARLIGEPATAD